MNLGRYKYSINSGLSAQAFIYSLIDKLSPGTRKGINPDIVYGAAASMLDDPSYPDNYVDDDVVIRFSKKVNEDLGGKAGIKYFYGYKGELEFVIFKDLESLRFREVELPGAPKPKPDLSINAIINNYVRLRIKHGILHDEAVHLMLKGREECDKAWIISVTNGIKGLNQEDRLAQCKKRELLSRRIESVSRFFCVAFFDTNFCCGGQRAVMYEVMNG